MYVISNLVDDFFYSFLRSMKRFFVPNWIDINDIQLRKTTKNSGVRRQNQTWHRINIYNT